MVTLLKRASPATTPDRYENRLLAVLFLAFGFVFFDRQALAFLAPYMDDDFGLSNSRLGVLSGVLALTWALAGMFAGSLSDRLGRRKPILIGAVLLFSLFSAASGLMSGFLGLLVDSPLLLGTLMILTYTGLGCFTLFMATIPAETVPRAALATALGVIMGVGELAGGFLGPLVAGRAADVWGLDAAMFIAAGGAALVVLLSFGLRETAPAVLRRRGVITS